jgi:phosphatidylinositol glycan class C protein
MWWVLALPNRPAIPPNHLPTMSASIASAPQFVHVLFCLQLYLLSPFMRRYVRAASLGAHVGLTAAMAAAAAALLARLSPALACVFVGLVLFVSLACPWWLVHIHKFKAKINGPWDEAVPQVPTHLM